MFIFLPLSHPHTHAHTRTHTHTNAHTHTQRHGFYYDYISWLYWFYFHAIIIVRIINSSILITVAVTSYHRHTHTHTDVLLFLRSLPFSLLALPFPLLPLLPLLVTCPHSLDKALLIETTFRGIILKSSPPFAAYSELGGGGGRRSKCRSKRRSKCRSNSKSLLLFVTSFMLIAFAFHIAMVSMTTCTIMNYDCQYFYYFCYYTIAVVIFLNEHDCNYYDC